MESEPLASVDGRMNQANTAHLHVDFEDGLQASKLIIYLAKSCEQ